jgi:hypothetical protein
MQGEKHLCDIPLALRAVREQEDRKGSMLPGRSDFLPFPPALPKEQHTGAGDGTFGDHDGKKSAFGPEMHLDREEPGQR